MSTLKVELLEGEQVVLECEGAVLTNQRLIVRPAGRRSIKGTGEVYLKDIASAKPVTGGQESKLKLGLIAGGVGVVLLGIEMLVGRALSPQAESVVFLVGALGIVMGLYFSLTTLVRVKPHTTVLFLVPGSDDLAVDFPGKNNPDADQLIRQFVRTKRGL